MSARIFVLPFAMLLFTGACGDDGDGPADTTGATADAPTTDDTAATTDESPTSTTEATPTTSDGETPTDATTDATTDVTTNVTTGDPSTDTGATTDVDTTTGGLDPDALSACQGYCERWGECGFQPDLAGCIAGCSDNQWGLVGECKQANLNVLVCFTALSCDDLLVSVDENSAACSEQKAAVTAACAGDECAQSVLGGGDECEVQLECPDGPVQKMVCDAQTCTCLEDELAVGECAAEGVCAAGDAIVAKAATCCGF
ncbi:hypothetical protein [Nannocystis pusilla]|uniref:hypothetical protein n=1 Tax=Nannocystis pusilla TaxID=889268 RepID=UPI003DA682C8